VLRRAGSLGPGAACLVRVRLALLCLTLAVTTGAGILLPTGAGAVPGAVVASFTYTPKSPLSGQTVTFTSTSTVTGPENKIVTQSWDLDGDGQFDDATGGTATRAYPRPGTRNVSLRVTDSLGNHSDATKQVVVGNRPPVPSMALVPQPPVAAQPTTFVSTSTDPDGYIKSQAWDLDNDGKFDDGTDVLAAHVFPTAGVYVVRLLVVDDSGASRSASVTITVKPPTALPPSGSGGVGSLGLPRLLSPFPIVRISGIVNKKGIELRLLSVSTPVGASVSVHCRGKGCPFRRRSWKVRPAKRSTGGQEPQTRVIRIRSFRRKPLRAGASVQVFVTRADAVGKYTRFKVRRGRLPARADRCLMRDDTKPVRCPS
jgi:PKD repeat protein